MRVCLCSTMIGVASMLLGCASPSAKTDIVFPSVIRLKEPARSVFDRLAGISSACYPSAGSVVKATFNEADQQGTLTYTLGVTTFALELARVDVRKDGTGSAVLMRARNGADNDIVRAVPKWLRGEAIDCPYK